MRHWVYIFAGLAVIFTAAFLPIPTSASQLVRSHIYNTAGTPLKLYNFATTLTDSIEGATNVWIDFSAYLVSNSDKKIMAEKITVNVYDALGHFLRSYGLISSSNILPHDVEDDYFPDSSAQERFHRNDYYRPVWSFENQDENLPEDAVAYVSEVRFADGSYWSCDGPSDSSPTAESFRHAWYVSHGKE